MVESGRAEERGWADRTRSGRCSPRIRRANNGMALLALWLVRAVKRTYGYVRCDARRVAVGRAVRGVLSLPLRLRFAAHT